jgi:hypothetical protein
MVASCSAPAASTAAPPTVVCGTVLNNSDSGAVLYNATRPLPVIRYETMGGLLYFSVSRGCAEGTHVSWVPSSAAHLVKTVRTGDGLMAAVALRPATRRSAFRLTGIRDGRVIAKATVRLRP